MSHPQVVEDEARPERSFPHYFGNGLRMPTAKRRRRVMFSGPKPVRIWLRSSSQVPDGQYAFRRCLLRCAARDPQCNLTALRAGLFVDGFALDQKYLPNMREVEGGIERRAAPNAPRLDAAMIGRRNLDEIRFASRLEQQHDIELQRRLVALDSEMIMRLLFDHIRG